MWRDGRAEGGGGRVEGGERALRRRGSSNAAARGTDRMYGHVGGWV
jgi:hypothetical protein